MDLSDRGGVEPSSFARRVGVTHFNISTTPLNTPSVILDMGSCVASDWRAVPNKVVSASFDIFPITAGESGPTTAFMSPGG